MFAKFAEYHLWVRKGKVSEYYLRIFALRRFLSCPRYNNNIKWRDVFKVPTHNLICGKNSFAYWMWYNGIRKPHKPNSRRFWILLTSL